MLPDFQQALKPIYKVIYYDDFRHILCNDITFEGVIILADNKTLAKKEFNF